MKIQIKKYLSHVALGAVVLSMASCNDFLDRQPLSQVSPEVYFKTEADFAAFSIARYGILPNSQGYSLGVWTKENGTDNLVQGQFDNIWKPGEVRVPEKGGEYTFRQYGNANDNAPTYLYDVNYFIRKGKENYDKGVVTGTQANVAHYLGEGYFFRAFWYFERLVMVGDFPIVTNVLPDVKEVLRAASVRKPRNEVARFILKDLDTAISMMLSVKSVPGGKNRVSKEAALMLKSRVALFEASFEKNFNGTDYVPNGPTWPGKKSHPNYAYNNANEVNFFIDECMKASEAIADAFELTPNTPTDNNIHNNPGGNPYYDLFGAADIAGMSESILFRKYNATLPGEQHYNGSYFVTGGNTGVSRQFVDAALMANGLPTYATGSGFLGDDSIRLFKADRDSRLQIFVQTPGGYTSNNTSVGARRTPWYPNILDLTEMRCWTGIPLKKGMGSDPKFQETGANDLSCFPVFRATEAYLNYIEAYYMKNNSIGGKADIYWRAIRSRAKVDQDYTKTIAATDMAKEARGIQGDMAAYTANKLVDATMYNIRRERRVELGFEGYRMNDLRRWRALDQLIVGNNTIGNSGEQGWIGEGLKIWGPLDIESKMPDNQKLIQCEAGNAKGNVSAKTDSEYVRPTRRVIEGNNHYMGQKWHSAHYLSPIAQINFRVTSEDIDDKWTTSTLYQNPGWEINATTLPTKVGGF